MSYNKGGLGIKNRPFSLSFENKCVPLPPLLKVNTD